MHTLLTLQGPLTTTFTPSTGCNSVVWGPVYTQFNAASLSDSNKHTYHSLGFSETSECHPPGFLAFLGYSTLPEYVLQAGS